MFKATGQTALKKTCCAFESLAKLALMLSLQSTFLDVPLNTLIFFGGPHEDLQN